MTPGNRDRGSRLGIAHPGPHPDLSRPWRDWLGTQPTQRPWRVGWVPSPVSRPPRSASRSGARSALGSPYSARGSRLAARGSPRGFTLIEILIVVTIIGILITLAQPSYQRAVAAAKEATLKEDLFILRDVIDQFYADNTKYPQALNDLVEKRYLRRIPKDPITGSDETWTLVHLTDEQGQQQGIFDVRSGSEATALDGTRYSDW